MYTVLRTTGAGVSTYVWWLGPAVVLDGYRFLGISIEFLSF
jgi:hypothetical protein